VAADGQQRVADVAQGGGVPAEVGLVGGAVAEVKVFGLRKRSIT
jgi:hypothetical protein